MRRCRCDIGSRVWSGHANMPCSPLHDLSFCEINRRRPGPAGLGACLPNRVLASRRWFFATNSPAPLTIKTQVTPSGAPARFEKPTHAPAPAIPPRTCEPRGQSAFGGEAADNQGARSKQNCADRACLGFLGSNPDYSARSKTGTAQHGEDDDEVRVDPEDH